MRDGGAGSRTESPRGGARALPGIALALGLGLTLALAACGGSAGGAPSSASASGPPRGHGSLLRSEPYDGAIPPAAEAWRIVYGTSAGDGRPLRASALVVAPRGGGAHPVLVWAHGTTGVAEGCAPSLLAVPFPGGSGSLVEAALRRGWVVVAPDYPGLGEPGPPSFLLGSPEARSALDAVRAARRLRGLRLGRQTLVWGHSQGGGAALWVAIEQRRYAPDVPLAGIAALAPASDLRAIAAHLEGPFGTVLALYTLDAYSHAYAGISLRDFVAAQALPAAEGILGRCLSDPAALVSALGGALGSKPVLSRSLAGGALRARLLENSPFAPSGVPTFIGQGSSDQVVDPAVQRAFAARLCRAGQPLEYRAYPGRDHLSLIEAGSPLVGDLLAWSEARLAGAPAPRSC